MGNFTPFHDNMSIATAVALVLFMQQFLGETKGIFLMTFVEDYKI